MLIERESGYSRFSFSPRLNLYNFLPWQDNNDDVKANYREFYQRNVLELIDVLINF
jgi:hypothetical protein